jgi:EAL domain-containing protein (putative c-di-GMP-specific phosphodiesterase class I)
MSDPALLRTLLAPGGLNPRYQPIIQGGAGGYTLHAYECLMRGPAGTRLEPADVLFGYVRLNREEGLVDRMCIAAALAGAAGLAGAPPLSLNVHASTLGRDDRFADYLLATADSHGVAAARLTVEIVEQTAFTDIPTFSRTLQTLRAAGMKIAVDDIGIGYSNYRTLVEARPDYLKVDRYVTQGIQGDPYRQAVLESTAQLARKVGARVIVEGVETPEELDIAAGYGIDLFQGYYFARPALAGEMAAADFLHRPQPGPPRARIALFPERAVRHV